jgi:hypothetical protein
VLHPRRQYRDEQFDTVLAEATSLPSLPSLNFVPFGPIVNFGLQEDQLYPFDPCGIKIKIKTDRHARFWLPAHEIAAKEPHGALLA